MSRTCDYVPLAIPLDQAERVRWRCVRCGHVTEVRLSAPPVRACRRGRPGAGNGHCEARAPRAELTIPGEALSACGCRSVRLFACGRFGELVTLAGLSAETRRLVTGWNRETTARYNGRACDRCAWREAERIANPSHGMEAGELARMDPCYVTWQRFEADILRLFRMLPWPISGVIGCPRSGMFAASKIALLAGVPLWSAWRDRAPQPLGRGLRVADAKALNRAGPLVLIEDSVNTGHSLQAHLGNCPEGTISAAVYTNDRAEFRPQLSAWILPMPHFFEWHLVGSNLATATLWDMDGVICEDCPADCDDDGPKYAKWLDTVEPKTLPRLYPVGAIVTARLDKYRAETEAWLKRHGVLYNRLIMGPWRDIAQRHREYDPRRYKGGQYRKMPGAILFVESCPTQARMIWEEVQRPVACNTTGKLWM